MKVREALEKSGWQWVQINALAYSVAKILSNPCNDGEGKFLDREAFHKQVEDDYGDMETLIVAARKFAKNIVIEEIKCMLCEDSQGVVRNGLITFN